MPRTTSGGERFELLVGVGAAQREHGIDSRDLPVLFGAFDAAILDRLPHHSELVIIQSDNYRPRKKDDSEPCHLPVGSTNQETRICRLEKLSLASGQQPL